MAAATKTENPSGRKLLTVERARELLHYDPETGAFTWRINFGRNRAGSAAMDCAKYDYPRVTIDGVRYRAHRLAWLLMTGDWPADQVDHINCDKRDSRWANLRAATHSQNLKNIRQPRGRSGVLGVRIARSGRYIARLRLEGKTLNLGTFDTPEEAKAVRDEAARRLHGEFARHE